MVDRKQALSAAVEALARAAEACAAAGVSIIAYWDVRSGDDMLAIVSARASDDLATLTAAEMPIAIGDTVRVADRHGERAEIITRIGREWVHTQRNRYRISDGREPDPVNRRLHPHDLARVRRWLAKPARGAR